MTTAFPCRWVGVLAALLALAHGGCTPTQPPVRQPDPVSAHVVESRKVRNVMRSLLALVPEDPSWVEPMAEHERSVREGLRTTSLELAAQAERIEWALARRELPASQRRVFLGLADQLRERATRLSEEALQVPHAALQARFEQVIDTCHRCHDLFRGPADG